MRADRRFLNGEQVGIAAILGFFASLALLLGLNGFAAAESRIRDIRIEPQAFELEPGETRNLTALAVYDDDSTKDVTSEVIFESRDEEVVQVSGRTATAVGSGQTTLRAAHPPSGEDASEPAEVTVLEVTALSIQPADSTLQVGATVQLRALATLENGRTGLDVTSIVEWESGKRDVASVERGLVRGLALGDAEIKAEDRASGVKAPKNSAFVHVTAGGGGDPGAEIIRMWAEQTELSLLSGEVVDLRVTALLEGGTTVDVTNAVSYESTRSQVASVSTSGRVTAEAQGTTRIRIGHPSGAEVEREPEVWVGELEQLHLSPAARNLEVGGSLALRALGSFDNGRSLDLTEAVSWFSDGEDVVAVSNAPGTRGRVTGVRTGSAVVTARHRDFGVESSSSDGEFTVGPGGPPEPPGEDEEIRDLVFEPPLLRLRPGDSRNLRVFAVFPSGGTTDVSDRVQLTVRDTRVAVVEDGTEVTALTGGHTEVLAYDPISRVRARVRAEIEVTRLVSLRIDPASSLQAPGTTRQLRARADFDDGSTGVDVTNRVSWKSEQPGVASVDDGSAKGLVSALVVGVAEIRAQDPISGIRSDRSTGRLVVGDAVVAPSADIVELVFEPTHLVLAPGQVVSVAIFGVHPDGTREPLLASEVRLRSLERRYVTVTGDGAIAGRRGGVGEVLGEHSASGAQGRLAVTVREVTRVDIDPASVTVRIGDTFDLSALARFNDGSEATLLTGDVSWRSDASNVATVEAIGGKGRVTALEPGVAFIQARHVSSRVRSDASTGQVQVIDELVRIVVEPANVVLEVGDTRRFTAIGQFANGEVLDISDDVVWIVSNRAVARIDASGKLEALANGNLRVDAIDVRTALSSAQTGGGANVEVGATLTGLQVSADTELSAQPAHVRLMPGEAIRLYGLGVFEGAARPVDLSDRLVWATNDAQIVAVEPGGLASCLADGTAIVSVTDTESGIKSTTTLGDATVECDGEVGVLQVEPAETAIDFPKSKQMRAFRVFADGSKVEVTRSVDWTSTDPAVVSIVESGGDAGVATALADGIVTVSAFDPAFGISSSDPGGGNGTVTVRKTRVELRIFPNVPQPDPDGVFRGRVGDLLKFRARVTYASGATQGVNVRVQWTSSDTDVVLMGPLAGLPINEGRMLSPGETTITARWPADEVSPELTDTVDVQVRALP